MFEKALRIVQNGVAAGAYPGAAVAVGRGDTVYAQAAYGRQQVGGAPITPGTLFDLASLTKLVGPTMVTLRLMQKGTLAPDDRLDRWFDPADCPDEGLWQVRKDITLHQLLTHTAGFVPGAALWMLGRPQDAVRSILSSPPQYAPGDGMAYSDFGFILLQHLLQRATGLPLDALCQQEVFTPLGMRTAGFCPLQAGYTDIAAAEWPSPHGRFAWGQVHDENAFYLGGVSGNAGIFASLQDLEPFAAMASRRGDTPAGRYLTADVFDAAVQNHTPGAAEARGWGFHLKPLDPQGPAGEALTNGSYGHTGFTGTCLFVDAQTGLYGLLLTNAVHYGRDKTKFFAVRHAFYEAVAEAFACGEGL